MFKRNDTPSDSELVAALRAGQSGAVSTWYKTYSPRIHAFVAQKIDPSKDIEEIVQETFINALKRLSFFRGNSSLLTWMYSIARHEIADYYRKKYAKKAIKMLPLSELLPQRINDSHEVSEQVKAAFNKIDAHHVELLMLKYVDNKKVEEIAAELGKSGKSIESELFRARQAFKAAYNEVLDLQGI